MKTTLRRLQQLEQRHSAWIAATDTSGACEELMARVNRIAERLRADPNWESSQSRPSPKSGSRFRKR